MNNHFKCLFPSAPISGKAPSSGKKPASQIFHYSERCLYMSCESGSFTYYRVGSVRVWDYLNSEVSSDKSYQPLAKSKDCSRKSEFSRHSDLPFETCCLKLIGNLLNTKCRESGSFTHYMSWGQSGDWTI